MTLNYYFFIFLKSTKISLMWKIPGICCTRKFVSLYTEIGFKRFKIFWKDKKKNSNFASILKFQFSNLDENSVARVKYQAIL